MQPPLPNGTILQNRYCLLNILGQGGFGRTYLAEDRGRFQEKCALKEFIPQHPGSQILQKSKELFQREASILYQIKHPQIPQFRAAFAQNQRLFLVQDYVEGKTYRELLAERKAKNEKFTEAEVLRLLQQLLPVLDYIHSQGIVHRDISPDNVILRERDRTPVLIDFGVVKDIASKVQYPDLTLSATTVGKMGYAPSEQIQTGRAYPNSDLYSLAVMAIVLLTTQEPQVLFDENTLSWNWQKWIPPASPVLAQVLNRMLNYRPGDRYPDARAVIRALASPPNLTTPTNSSTKKPASQPPKSTNTPNLSEFQTVAVARKIEPNYSVSKPTPVIIPVQKSVWENPFMVFLLGIFLALFAGVGSWFLVSYILNRGLLFRNLQLPTITNQTSTATPTPLPTPSDVFPDATPTPKATETPSLDAEPVTSSKRLNPIPGQTLFAEDKLKSNVTINYIISGVQGQKLSALLTQEGVLMTVLAPNGETVDNQSRRVTRWEGILPYSGDYTIQLGTVKGVSESEYKLELFLTNPEPTPTPTAIETPTPTPTPIPTPTESPTTNILIDSEVINFPEGGVGTQILSDRTSPERIKRYLLNLQPGQVVSTRVINGDVTLDIRYPNGDLVENATGLGEWESKIDRAGEYKIDIKANQESVFSLDITVK
ncbi:serine/threonine protein kinase [Phormidium sp. LEGE 05292]|uniref:serine/threonine-protein kinase n=1 Tax=[Phormidium] sp. LEGE 05292 TaxID=767427 RepID=UPI0018817314|nr:serine/threonine-protein kinase [Phormidium sp. LEGE 05292]MBE9229057.1 serine/threonine protein kinase [Phormidium sp. LEGE 05292]